MSPEICYAYGLPITVVLHHTCSGAHGGHARFSGRAPHAGCHAARARLINVKRSGRCGQCARPGRDVVAPRAPARNRTPQARGGARRTPIRVCGCAVLFGLFAFVVVANAFLGVFSHICLAGFFTEKKKPGRHPLVFTCPPWLTARARSAAPARLAVKRSRVRVGVGVLLLGLL